MSNFGSNSGSNFGSTGAHQHELGQVLGFLTQFAERLEALRSQRLPSIESLGSQSEANPGLESEAVGALDVEQAIGRCEACLSPIADAMQQLEALQKASASASSGSPTAQNDALSQDLERLQELEREVEESNAESEQLRQKVKQAELQDQYAREEALKVQNAFDEMGSRLSALVAKTSPERLGSLGWAQTATVQDKVDACRMAMSAVEGLKGSGEKEEGGFHDAQSV